MNIYESSQSSGLKFGGIGSGNCRGNLYWYNASSYSSISRIPAPAAPQNPIHFCMQRLVFASLC